MGLGEQEVAGSLVALERHTNQTYDRINYISFLELQWSGEYQVVIFFNRKYM